MSMRGLLLIAALASSGAAIAAPQASGDASSAAFITPYDAIWRAAADPENGVTGKFRLTVQTAEQWRDRVYLDSELNYRDQRSLNIEVLPAAQAALRERLGGSIESIRGKTIIVSGTAKRTTVWFLVNGKQTDKYYYQTQIAVSNANQIEIL